MADFLDELLGVDAPETVAGPGVDGRDHREQQQQLQLQQQPSRAPWRKGSVEAKRHSFRMHGWKIRTLGRNVIWNTVRPYV